MASGSGKSALLIILGIFSGGVLIVIVLLFLAFWGFGSGSSDEEYSGTLSSGDKIGVIDISGEITASEDIIRQIETYSGSGGIRGLVVRVNSPGGAVAPSQEIYFSLRKFRESGKPVIISMGSVAASGGYYLSLGASHIFVAPGSITGSIGVILQYPQFKNLMDKVGVEMVTVKTGRYKDAGSPFREKTPEDLAYLQGLIDDTYDQFLETVSEERGISVDSVQSLAEGRVYTGRQAVSAGLVDTLGTFSDAVGYAAKLAGITGKPELVRKVRTVSLLEKLTGADSEMIGPVRELVASKPLVQYRMYP